MKAVVYNGGKIPVVEERKRPRLLTSQDAVIRVTLTTICSSDLHILRGAVPRAEKNVVLGHEFVGVVEEVGSQVKRIHAGQRVAVNVETFCGSCFFCQQGFVNNCTDAQGVYGCSGRLGVRMQNRRRSGGVCPNSFFR